MKDDNFKQRYVLHVLSEFSDKFVEMLTFETLEELKELIDLAVEHQKEALNDNLNPVDTLIRVLERKVVRKDLNYSSPMVCVLFMLRNGDKKSLILEKQEAEVLKEALRQENSMNEDISEYPFNLLQGHMQLQDIMYFNFQEVEDE